MIIETNSASETLALGEKLGKAAKPGQIYTLNFQPGQRAHNVCPYGIIHSGSPAAMPPHGAWQTGTHSTVLP